jgi:hypothetical protein
MKARPILMSAPMIRALIAGTKTQTRRTAKPQPECAFIVAAPGSPACPYGQPGDLLYVKENWAYRLDHDEYSRSQLYEMGVRQAWYWADGPGRCCNTGCDGAAGRVRTARFMPRWASRLTLRITDVRVQRLQEISEADAIAEGVEPQGARMHYCVLWKAINGAGSWAENPFVWCISFECIHLNVDEVLREVA